jgi:hypothetical protein
LLRRRTRALACHRAGVRAASRGTCADANHGIQVCAARKSHADVARVKDVCLAAQGSGDATYDGDGGVEISSQIVAGGQS